MLKKHKSKKVPDLSVKKPKKCTMGFKSERLSTFLDNSFTERSTGSLRSKNPKTLLRAAIRKDPVHSNFA